MYTLNPENAKQADTAGGRIDTTGKYIGKFTLAEHITAKSGTKGIEFSFRCDDGRSADYLTIYTINSEGKEIFGKKILDAIMTCLKIKSVSLEAIDAEKYDSTAGERRKTRVEAFPALMDKPIGLLLQAEPYQANDGSTKTKMVIALPFEASSGFTASEVLNRATTPEIMERRLATLRDRPMQARHNSSATSASTATEDFDDADIPF